MVKSLDPEALSTFFSLVEKALAAARVSDGPTLDRLSAQKLISEQLQQSAADMPTEFLFGLRSNVEVASGIGRGSKEGPALLGELRDALRGTEFIVPFGDEGAWVRALTIAKRFRRDSGEDTNNTYRSSRSLSVVRSLLRLKEKGFDCHVNAYGSALLDDALTRACAEVEKLVEKIGGLTVASSIFSSLSASEQFHRGLFLFGRRISRIPNLRDPSIPWHFLYNLALKHLTVQPTTRNLQTDWRELLTLSADIGASFNVEEYDPFGLGFFPILSPHRLNRAIVECLLYDELFSFQQWSADISLKLFDRWIDALSGEKCVFPIASPEEWHRLIKYLLSICNKTAPQVVGIHDFSLLPTPPSKTEEMLNAISTPASEINIEYRTPQDAAARSSLFCPLISVGKRCYFIPPTGLTARALYEKLFELMMSCADTKFDSKSGRALEQLVARTLIGEGIRPAIVAGRYSYPSKRYRFDVDLAVEAESEISFIECKKKALTARARSGNSVYGFEDLSKSFLEMLVQLTQHEIVLRKTGNIKFDDGKVLSLGGRQTERFAISLLNYGSLQGPTLIRSIVAGLLGVKLGHNEPEEAKRLESVNRTIEKLTRNLTELGSMAELEVGEFIRQFNFG